MAPPSAAAAVPVDAPRPPVARRLWIDGPWRDLVFYIATPLLLAPLVLLRASRPGLDEVLIYVGSFAALGHHLPGMMRAYGDRALFARFRVRFVLAPLVLVPVCVFFSLENLGGIVLVTFFWTSWHSLMQIFGFARIYDAKVGATQRWTARLDQALCLAWIGAPLLLSDGRLARELEMWYASGGPLVAPAFLGALRSAWRIGTLAVSALWLMHTAFAWHRGSAPSPAKLALFASSFVTWWLCMAVVDNLLVGVALFDVVHDVQYLALVWTFNKARVAADPRVGGFARFLFRGGATLAGVYVGLVVAYGSLGYFSDQVPEELVRKTLLGVLAASALLHFYFDGFIWKVREPATRAGLRLAAGDAQTRPAGGLPRATLHGAKWLAFFVPLGTFYAWDLRDQRPERLWREAVVAAAPRSAEALTSLAAVMDVRAEPDQVLALHRRAIAEKPTYAVAYNNLGVALCLLGRIDEARGAFLEAIRRFPHYSVAHRHLGALLVTTGEAELAEQHFRSAIEQDPRDASALAGLALLDARRGEAAQAIELFERALRFKPTEGTALNGLAWLLATHPAPSLRDGARAVEYAQRLVELSGRTDPMVLDTLAAAQAEAGVFDGALATLAEARSLPRARGDAVVTAVLERHRASYERGQPWRGER